MKIHTFYDQINEFNVSLWQHFICISGFIIAFSFSDIGVQLFSRNVGKMDKKIQQNPTKSRMTSLDWLV